MNATQAENLRILIRHMETGCERTLDMDVFDRCGTPACALGEAKAIGLVPDAFEEMMGGFPVFGVRGHGVRLFGESSNNAWRRQLVTPQEWAVEARAVLAENGYSMDEPKPAQTFQSFMAKALEPVDTRDTKPMGVEEIDRIRSR